MLQNAKDWASRHILLTSLHHFAAGFGIALLLEHYITGSAFVPTAMGVALIAFSTVVHFYAWTRG